MLYVESYAENALKLNQIGKNAFNECLNTFLEIRNNPTIIQSIKQIRAVGQALMLLLAYGEISDEDTCQCISSLSYFFFSKAIIEQDFNRNLHKDRVLLMISQKRVLNYTIMNSLQENRSLCSIADIVSNADDEIVAIEKMKMYDFMKGGDALIEFAPLFKNSFIDILKLLGEGRFGDVDLGELANEGDRLHQKVYRYLYKNYIEYKDINI